MSAESEKQVPAQAQESAEDYSVLLKILDVCMKYRFRGKGALAVLKALPMHLRDQGKIKDLFHTFKGLREFDNCAETLDLLPEPQRTQELEQFSIELISGGCFEASLKIDKKFLGKEITSEDLRKALLACIKEGGFAEAKKVARLQERELTLDELRSIFEALKLRNFSTCENIPLLLWDFPSQEKNEKLETVLQIYQQVGDFESLQKTATAFDRDLTTGEVRATIRIAVERKKYMAARDALSFLAEIAPEEEAQAFAKDILAEVPQEVAGIFVKFLPAPQKTEWQEKILKERISQGSTGEAINMAKQIGRSLTQEELEMLFLRNFDQQDRHNAEKVVERMSGPRKDLFLAILNA